MRNSIKIALVLMCGLVLIVGIGGYYFFGPSTVPAESDYTIDRQALEQAISAEPGPLPVRVDHIKVAELSLPTAAVFSGLDFAPHPMVHGAYQVVYADGSYVLIDSAFGREVFDEMASSAEGAKYDAAAFESLKRAIPGARAIVITHEHLDHIQGLAEVEDLASVAERVFISVAQHNNPETAELLPAELLGAMNPLPVEGARAIAPGVVVYPAAGHTPGSQLVYVTTEGGARLLFIGDVAWHMDAIRQLRYRPRIVTDLILGEDRQAVMAQYRTLHQMLDDSTLQIISSHDGDQLKDLQARGILGKGMQP